MKKAVLGFVRISCLAVFSGIVQDTSEQLFMEFRRNFPKEIVHGLVRQFFQCFGEVLRTWLVVAEILDLFFCRIKGTRGRNREILHKLCKVFPVVLIKRAGQSNQKNLCMKRCIVSSDFLRRSR